MARVPTVSGPSVDLAGPNGAQIASPQTTLLTGGLPAPKLVDPQVQLERLENPQLDPGALAPGLTQALAAIPGQQLERTGANLSAAGGEMADIAQQIQLQTNAVVTDKAVNDAKEVALRLQYGTGQNGEPLGFTQIKGWDAINRPPSDDGTRQPLADEYTAKYAAGVSAIRDTLQNDQQRRAFDIQSGDIKTSLYGAATQHETQEFQGYNLSVAEGTIATEKQVIGLNYKDPVQMQKSMDRITGAVAQQALLTGKSATWAKAQGQLQVADGLEGAVKSAIGDQNFAVAQALMNTYKDQMTPGALADAKRVVNNEMDTRIGMNAGMQAVQSVANTNAHQSSTFGQLVTAVGAQESGNRDFKADGTPVTSPKGAVYRMQVMPDNFKDLGPNPTAAQVNARGEHMLASNVQRYAGDISKAVAAYNSNPKTVDWAVKQAALPANAGKSWLSFMPAETQAYVPNVLAKLQAGAPPTMQWSDVQAKIQASGLTPTQQMHALTVAHEQFDYLEKDKTRRDEDITAQATQQLAAGTPYDKLAPEMKAAIPGQKIPELQKYSQTVQEGGNIATNADVQLKMMDDGFLRSMTDQQFMNTKTVLSDAVWTSFAEHRRTLLAGGGQGPGDLNTPTIKTTVDGLLKQSGIEPNPVPVGMHGDPAGVQRVAAINQYVRDAVLTAQKQAGKKFDDAATENFIYKLWSRDVHFKDTFMGFETGGKSNLRMLTMQLNDVPAPALDALKKSFKANGVPNPTDGQLLGAYFHNPNVK